MSEKEEDILGMVTDLRQKFNQKFDDQLFIIEQQRDRIDYQQQQINDQRIIIEELTWQIRDLRDAVQKCIELFQITSSQKDSIKHLDNELTDDSNGSNEVSSQKHKSINHGASPAPSHLERKLRKQQANVANDGVAENNRVHNLNFAMPSPPKSSPPNYDSDSEHDEEPIQVSSETFEKLNKLYEMRQFVRKDKADAIDLDDVIARIKNFKDCSIRVSRANSKTLGSIVSDYGAADCLPRLDEEDGEVNLDNNDDKSPQKQFRTQKSEDELYI